MEKRTLSLRREALGELSPDDLRVVNGGGPPTLKTCTTLNGCEFPTFDYSCFNCISHPPCTLP